MDFATSMFDISLRLDTDEIDFAVKLALKNIQKKQDVELMAQKIQDARANLMLSLMIYLEDQTTQHQKELGADHRNIVQEAQKVIEQTSTIKAGIASLTSKLSELKIDDREFKKAWDAALHENGKTLEDIAQKLGILLERINTEFSAASSQFQRLRPVMDRELLARQRILQSLYFTKMNDRRNNVARAHRKTYQWIFKPKDDRKVLWDDFLHWLCQQDYEPIYWIFGKPGCGKTTMMRELDERISKEVESQTWVNPNDSLQNALQKWVGQGDLLKGCCYFWYAGAVEQKSMPGLLQSLAYQLLQQRPDLIDKVVPADRWESASYPEFHMRQWEESELIGVLDSITKRAQAVDKILLFIDGLDEYDGPDQQREELLSLLQRLTRSPHVKACIASRPWNIFLEAFRECPGLCLEDLTKSDISDYVHEKLGEDPLFKKQQQRNPYLLEKISSVIITKARGVFLWVHLVVRELLRILRDGGRSSHLFQELERIPPDLDDYFLRMIETIEKPYRKDAAMILQAALCNMDYSQDDSEILASGPDLYLIHLDYLDEGIDPCFAARSQNHMFDDYQDEQAIDDILESLCRRLASRCMGLLEVGMATWWFIRPSQEVSLTRIEFLHRTVRDWLLKPSAQRILYEYADGNFDAHLFRCNLLIIDVTTSIMSKDTDGKFASISCFLRQIQDRPASEETSFILFEKMAGILEQQGPEFTSWLRNGHSVKKESFIALTESILHWKDEVDSAMSLAIKLGWRSYIESRLTQRTIEQKHGRPLLDYALRPCYQKIRNPDLWIVKRILEEGASPDEVICRKENVPVWAHFLESIQLIKHMDYTVCLNTIVALLEHGIRTGATQAELQSIFSDLILRIAETDEAFLSRKQMPVTTTSLCEKALGLVPRLLERLKQPTTNAETDLRLYSPIEVLRSLTPLASEVIGVPLFLEEDIVRFEQLQRKQSEISRGCKRRRSSSSNGCQESIMVRK
jgi:hypothetical protein